MVYKYYSFTGKLNDENMDKFIDFVNKSQGEPIFVIMNTLGGSSWHADTLIHILSDYPDATIFVHGVYSSGLRVLVESDCKKLLAVGCRGMWHYGVREVSINDLGKPAYNEDVCILKELKTHRTHAEEFAKKIMTDSEFKKFKKDKDIYFDEHRMKQILEANRKPTVEELMKVKK